MRLWSSSRSVQNSKFGIKYFIPYSSIVCLIDFMTLYRFIDSLIHCLLDNSSLGWLMHLTTLKDRLIVRLIGWLNVWLVGSSVGRSIDWLIGSITRHRSRSPPLDSPTYSDRATRTDIAGSVESETRGRGAVAGRVGSITIALIRGTTGQSTGIIRGTVRTANRRRRRAALPSRHVHEFGAPRRFQRAFRRGKDRRVTRIAVASTVQCRARLN